MCRTFDLRKRWSEPFDPFLLNSRLKTPTCGCQSFYSALLNLLRSRLVPMNVSTGGPGGRTPMPLAIFGTGYDSLHGAQICHRWWIRGSRELTRVQEPFSLEIRYWFHQIGKTLVIHTVKKNIVLNNENFLTWLHLLLQVGLLLS